MKRNYQVFLKIKGFIYTNYYSTKKDLKRALEFFTKEKGLVLGDTIQINKKTKNGNYYILI